MLNKIRELQEKAKQYQWEGTFEDYLEIVKKDPKVTQLAHARLYDMIMENGSETFFEQEIFGIEKPLKQLTEFFRSSAKRLETRKRILLLIGAPGSGKSTLCSLIKDGLEAYTKKHPVYAISSCPQQEEPLHLVPPSIRKEIEKEYGVYIEGSLCPQCQKRYGGDWDILKTPVKRVLFSERERIGIGTYSPKDAKDSDIADLVGSINLSKIGEIGIESDPDAYCFDGELNVANRGFMEFVEILKAQIEQLYVLLTLSEEHNIKTGRFPFIYADECVAGHSNLAEYKAFVANKKNEALADRMLLINVPYNLKVSQEQRIYDKLIRESGMTNVHISPLTLKVASTFAVLSRLEKSKRDVPLITKVKLYDGEKVVDFTDKDVKELQEEHPHEGMDGISPRYIINTLSKALVKENTSCINPIDTLRALKDGFDQATNISETDKEKYLDLLDMVREEYDNEILKQIQRAFIFSFKETSQAILDNYIANVEAFCKKEKVLDPITDEEIDPDIAFMSSIEEEIGVSPNSAKEFRERIMISIASLAMKGKKFEPESDEMLFEAIQKHLFASMKDSIMITTGSKVRDAEQKEKFEGVAKRMVEDLGYCPTCAKNSLNYCGQLLRR